MILFLQARDAAGRHGNPYLSTDYSMPSQSKTQAAPTERRRSNYSKEGSRRGSRESLESVGESNNQPEA